MAPLTRTARRRREGGLALVEMALVLPLLVLLLFALIEYGWLFYKYQQINGAARQGCRIAVTQPATTAQVTTAVDQLMAQFGMAGVNYDIVLTPPAVEQLPGITIEVRVEVPYEDLELTGFPLPLPTQLVGEMSMVKEGAP
jgi:Flp pilus assembly protein TadG